MLRREYYLPPPIRIRPSKILTPSSQNLHMFTGEGNFEKNKDVFVCTEPAVMCWVLRIAFPDHPIVGYFGNPLMTYLGTNDKSVHHMWLAAFNTMTNFIPVASTRFLAEQMKYQSGRPVGAVRPLALYLDSTYEPPPGKPSFLILRQPFVFWDSGDACSPPSQRSTILTFPSRTATM